jgi:hypothetical protein
MRKVEPRSRPALFAVMAPPCIGGLDRMNSRHSRKFRAFEALSALTLAFLAK